MKERHTVPYKSDRNRDQPQLRIEPDSRCELPKELDNKNLHQGAVQCSWQTISSTGRFASSPLIQRVHYKSSYLKEEGGSYYHHKERALGHPSEYIYLIRFAGIEFIEYLLHVIQNTTDESII